MIFSLGFCYGRWPDFFSGEVVDWQAILAGDLGKIDFPAFLTRNSRENREPILIEVARALRSKYHKFGAIGFCYGGWAVCRLGANNNSIPLADAISMGHPSLLVEKDIDDIVIPLQVLAPEFDEAYTPKLKSYTFNTLQKKGVEFDYQHFPGVEHACFIRGDPKKVGERQAVVRAKDAAVSFFKHYLQD